VEFDKIFMGGVLVLLAFGVINANLPGKNKKKKEEEEVVEEKAESAESEE